MLTRVEGIIPALESAHALGVLDRRKFAPDEVVVINLSGRGDKDINTKGTTVFETVPIDHSGIFPRVCGAKLVIVSDVVK